MKTLMNKIDFAVVIGVKNANPNGDPLNGNRPRTNYDGYGEITDVCIKRKIRNGCIDKGIPIFVQSDDKKVDEYKTLRERAEGELKKLQKDEQLFAAEACKRWFDVRAFGQVFAYKGEKKDGKGVSIGIRGPVSIHSAFSVTPINISSIQITKSVSSDGDGTKKASDTMGMKHRVDHGIYVFYGSINPQLANKTGFSDEDAEIVKDALITLFQNDASTARPEGSMEVHKVYWWRHNSQNGQYASAKVHRSLKVSLRKDIGDPKDIEDYDITYEPLPELNVEVYNGR